MSKRISDLYSFEVKLKNRKYSNKFLEIYAQFLEIVAEKDKLILKLDFKKYNNLLGDYKRKNNKHFDDLFRQVFEISPMKIPLRIRVSYTIIMPLFSILN